ncbi:MAG: glycosyltransferase [Muribaculaceae bacterium]|nr:glycosyltransferase [Muribaculaceae bacterium]
MNINNPPCVSVVMGCFGEPSQWIQEAIDSILNQTFSDFEFIIINDNPERKELSDFLEENRLKDNRIKVINNETNIGLTKSLNIGLNESKGKYIARMDADDISLPRRFEKQVKYLNNHPECGIIGCWIEMFGSKTGVFKCKENDEDLKSIQFFQSPFDHPATMMRTSVLKDCGIKYNENLRYAQDQDLWASLSKVCEFYNVQEILFKHRFNHQQVSKNHSSEQSNNVKITRTKLIHDYLAKYNLERILEQEISVSLILKLLNKADSLKLSTRDQKNINRIVMSLLMSLKSYSIPELTRFIFSTIYMRKTWSVKEFIRVIRAFITRKHDSYLGIINYSRDE